MPEIVTWIIVGGVTIGALVTLGNATYTICGWLARWYRRWGNTCYFFERNELMFHGLTLALQNVFNAQHGVRSFRTLETTLGLPAISDPVPVGTIRPRVRSLVLPADGVSLTITNPNDSQQYFYIYMHAAQYEILIPPRKESQPRPNVPNRQDEQAAQAQEDEQDQSSASYFWRLYMRPALTFMGSSPEDMTRWRETLLSQ